MRSRHCVCCVVLPLMVLGWTRRGLAEQGHSIRGHVSLRYEEEYPCAIQLISFISECYWLSGEQLRSAGLFYICRIHPYYQMYFFEKLQHGSKEMSFDRRHRMSNGDSARSVGWHDVECCTISPYRQSQFVITVPFWGRKDEHLRLLYATATPYLLIILRTIHKEHHRIIWFESKFQVVSYWSS